MTTLIDYLLTNNGEGLNLNNADCDKSGEVNIGDVTTLIDMLLSGVDEFPAEANVNGDETVSISDVTALIDKLLSGN